MIVISTNREIRKHALKLIQNSAQESIIKEASAVDFLKDAFQSFYDGIKSQVNTDEPVLSVLNFLTVGTIAAYSPVLGLILSILGTSFGINFSVVFKTIINALIPHLNTPEARNNLEKNQNSIVSGIVDSALGPLPSEDEIKDKLQDAAGNLSEASYQYGIVKEAQKLPKLPMFAGIVRKLVPTLGSVLGGRNFGISNFIGWIIKTFLAGAAFIGVGGALKKIVTPDSEVSKPKPISTEEESTKSEKKPSETKETTSLLTSSNEIFNDLKLSSDVAVIKTRSNNAPNDQSEGVDGGQEWTVPGDLANNLYHWVFSTYKNAAEILRKNNISEEKLRSAAKTVAYNFMRETKYSPESDKFRIPNKYDNIKDVVDAVISKAIK